MKIRIAVILFIIGAIIFARSQTSGSDFAQAEDFPRGAVIYAQFADLPQFVDLWENSELKKRYLASENFRQLKNRHLWLKIADRLNDFNDAAGFPLDFSAFGKMAETRAAIAVYDIGRLDIVFVAPVNDEIFEAIDFVQNKDRFEEITLEDGTKFYSQALETDGGRQKQKLVFTNYKGRFILASDEKLFLRTIAVISGKNEKNSLADEPDFHTLVRKQNAHAATVWVNQTELNNDYYFRRYWLMPNRAELKKFRAAIFDLEISEANWTERRAFLLAEKQNAGAKIDETQARRLVKMLPETTAFYNLRAIENKPDAQAEAISKTLFENSSPLYSMENRASWNRRDYFYADFGSSGDERSYVNYNRLDDEFDEKIDEEEDFFEEKAISQNDKNFSNSLREILASAHPKIVLSAANPKVLPAPLFMEFRRLAILKLENPNNLNAEKLENLLAENLQNEITIGDKSTKLNWETKNENGKTWRELDPPTLGWGIAYALDGNDLIFSNSADLMREILLRERETVENSDEKSDESFNELTVINLAQREPAFDNLMNKLVLEESASQTVKQTDNFFADNIGSLLDAGKDVEKIEIRRGVSTDILREKLDFVFK